MSAIVNQGAFEPTKMCASTGRPGSSSSPPVGTMARSRVRSMRGMFEPQFRTENLREVLRVRHRVGGELLLTAREPDAASARQQVRGVRGRALFAAAAAVKETPSNGSASST